MAKSVTNSSVTNKSALVALIAEKAELTLLEAEKTLTATLNIIISTLTGGNAVSLVGFGNFGVKKRAARKARNPQTGKEIFVEAVLVPFFKAGKNLKEEVDS
jgi:DNA-binding protein HU-beta